MFDATIHTTMNKSKEISLDNFRGERSISSGNVTNLKTLQSDDHMCVLKQCLLCEQDIQHLLMLRVITSPTHACALRFRKRVLTQAPHPSPARANTTLPEVLAGWRNIAEGCIVMELANMPNVAMGHRIAYHAITLWLGDLFKDRGIE